MMRCSAGVCRVASLLLLGMRKVRGSTPMRDPAHGQ